MTEQENKINALEMEITRLKRELEYKRPPFRSEQIDKISLALSMAQGKMLSAEKRKEAKVSYRDKEGKWINSPPRKYADFEDIVKAIKKPLSESEISFKQIFSENYDTSGNIITEISHSSGQWYASYNYVPSVKELGSPQVYGSYLTHLQRYALKAIVGLPTGENDDDGEISTNSSSSKEIIVEGLTDNAFEPRITLEQYEILKNLFDNQHDLLVTLLKNLNIESLRDIKQDQFNKVFSWINQKRMVLDNLQK